MAIMKRTVSNSKWQKDRNHFPKDRELRKSGAAARPKPREEHPLGLCSMEMTTSIKG